MQADMKDEIHFILSSMRDICDQHRSDESNDYLEYKLNYWVPRLSEALVKCKAK